jgi:6,7-dimethyl-8-ribityllumazine synthase
MNILSPNFAGAGLRVGIVQSRYNEHVVNKMTAYCEKELLARGVIPDDIDHATVPGALEIPLALQTLALTERYDALIAVGAVIRGETYHFEVVANQSARGVMEVMLETGVPVANAILTTDTEQQALERIEEKSAEAARVAIEMANLVKAVRKPQ